MYAIDSSAIIHGWEQYPIYIFPKIWEFFAHKQTVKEFQYSEIVMNEVYHKSSELYQWLQNNNASKIELSNDIVQFANTLKRSLGIEEDSYHSKGVDENDLLIIATAKINNLALVTNESIQITLPDVMSKYKIPTVCKLNIVEVQTLNFLELLKNYKETF